MARPRPGQQRGEKLWNIRFANNCIKNWRRDAQSINYTEVRNIKNVIVDGNTYDPPEGKPMWFWWGKGGQEVKLGSLNEVRQVLGFEVHGKVANIPFDRPLIPTVAGLNTQVAKDGEAFSIDAAVAKAKPGDTVEIPVHGRLDINAIKGGWSTEVYDLAVQSARRCGHKERRNQAALETKVSRFASLTPRLITVKLTKLAEYDMRGEVLSIGQKATVTPAPRNVAANARLLQRNAFADVKEAADFASFMTYGDYRPAQVVTNAVAVANGTLRIRTNHTVVTAKTFDPLAAPDQRLVVKFTIKSWTGKQLGDPVEFSVVLANRDRMDQAEKAGGAIRLVLGPAQQWRMAQRFVPQGLRRAMACKAN